MHWPDGRRGRGGGGSAGRLTVTSTLDGLPNLPAMIRWIATLKVPSGDQVTEVDFLIDGKLTWIGYDSPYVFGSGDEGPYEGYLFTTWLSPGAHSFAARMLNSAGRTAAGTVTAQVSPPLPPPARLRGIWTRVMTARDVARARVMSRPPPPGRWKLDHQRVRPPQPRRLGLHAGRVVRQLPLVGLRPPPDPDTGPRGVPEPAGHLGRDLDPGRAGITARIRLSNPVARRAARRIDDVGGYG